MVEVLSPVGSYEMLYAAVRSGADAVYFGAGDFNARRNAENFGREELKSAVEYCHVRGVKAYMTLNTILCDNELKRAFSEAVYAAQCGIDAFITADLGLASLLCEGLPDVPLHASTQMTVHSPAALPALKKMGFSRVVISREMDKNSIASFCREAKKIGMETEVFVHGALCMCMSGQCYLSSVLGGRSGNRGLCAQPCRLPFKVEGGTGNDLSLKDMSLIDHIGELADMGVTSLKIEGRMKRPEYVAAATKAVRDKVDGVDITQIDSDLKQVFSRSGFTDGYYRNSLGKSMFGIRTKDDVQNTAAVLKGLHNIYRAERQSIPVSATVELFEDKTSLCLSDGKNTVCVVGAGGEKAVQRPADRDYLFKQLSKLGKTPYYLEKLDAKIGEGLTLSAAQLNELRRNAADELTNVRKAAKKVTVFTPEFRHGAFVKKQPRMLLQFANLGQLPVALPENAAVILPIETDFSAININNEIMAHMPRGIMDNEQKYLGLLKKAKENGVKTVLCGTLATIEMCKAAGLCPFADFSMNTLNSHSLEVLKAIGAVGAVVSFEGDIKTLSQIDGGIPTALTVYGYLPLMLTRNCPNKNGGGCKTCGGVATLSDRKGESFKIMCRNGFSEILNGHPLVMSDRKAEAECFDYHLLRFTYEDKSTVAECISAYQNGDAPRGKFTRGLYYRELL